MDGEQGRVVIGMDPHKRSVTIEVMASDEQVLGGREVVRLVLGLVLVLRAERRYLAEIARWIFVRRPRVTPVGTSRGGGHR